MLEEVLPLLPLLLPLEDMKLPTETRFRHDSCIIIRFRNVHSFLPFQSVHQHLCHCEEKQISSIMLFILCIQDNNQTQILYINCSQIHCISQDKDKYIVIPSPFFCLNAYAVSYNRPLCPEPGLSQGTDKGAQASDHNHRLAPETLGKGPILEDEPRVWALLKEWKLKKNWWVFLSFMAMACGTIISQQYNLTFICYQVFGCALNKYCPRGCCKVTDPKKVGDSQKQTMS